MVKFGGVVANANLVERNPEENGITRIVGLEHIDPENLHIHRWNNISEGTSFTRKFVPGQTLFGKRRAYQRKVAYAEFTGICSGDILTFEPKDRNILLPELLPFICQSDAFFSYALDTSAGSLSPRTSWTALKNFSFPLPPLEEQKRLAELLWAADNTIFRYEILANQYKKIKKIILRDCTKNCDRWVYLSDIAQNITSGSRGWANFYSSNGSKFIRITNLHRGCIRIDLNDIQHVSPPPNLESERTRIKRNDLLISITADLGLVAVADRDIGDAYVNQHIAKISLDENIYNPLFAAYFFADTMGQKQFSRFNDQGAKAGLNLKNIGKLKLPFIQKKEQKIFSYLLAKIDKKNQKTLSHIESLRRVMRALCDNWGK